MDRGSPPLLGSCQILSSYSRRDLGSTIWQIRLLGHLEITNGTNGERIGVFLRELALA